jgi:hypothetical protein
MSHAESSSQCEVLQRMRMRDKWSRYTLEQHANELQDFGFGCIHALPVRRMSALDPAVVEIAPRRDPRRGPA